jgi:hypothetical protein
VPSHWRAYGFPESLPCANAQAEPARLSTAFLVNARACRACAERHANRFVADQHLPSKRDPRLQQLHFLLLPSQVFNNLGLCFSLKANPNGMKDGILAPLSTRTPQKQRAATKQPMRLPPTINAMARDRARFAWLAIRSRGTRKPSTAKRKTNPSSTGAGGIEPFRQPTFSRASSAQTCYQVQILWPIGKPQRRKQP